MKKILSIVFATAALTVAAQPKKAPKMAPITESGYYVAMKGDTVRGDVRTNPDDETEIYRQFFFKPANQSKLAAITPKKAKAYGFGGRHFIYYNGEGEDMYLEQLTWGRLLFFERKLMGKIDGYDAVVSEYYAQDTRGEGMNANLKEIRKISNKFYKRDLKPFMLDQPMIWSDLDKFTFDKNAVVTAINEFNKYYVVEGN